MEPCLVLNHPRQISPDIIIKKVVEYDVMNQFKQTEVNILCGLAA